MAATGLLTKGLSFIITADDTKFQSSIKQVNDNLKTVASRSKTLKNLMKFDPYNADLARERFQTLGNQINQTSDKLQAMKLRLQSMKEEDIGSANWNKLSRQINSSEESLARLKEEAKRAKKEMDDLAQPNLKKFADGMEHIGDRLTGIANKFKLLSGSAGVALGSATKVFVDFDDAMRNVKSIMAQITDEEFARMRAAAEELGATTRFTSKEAADAMYELASAGLDANQIIGVTPAVLDLAAAAKMGLAEAADLTAVAMKTYGYEAEEASIATDQIFKTSTLTLTKVPELAEAFKSAASKAAASNQKLSTTNAILGMLAEMGVKGSEAGTALSRALADLTKKSKDGAVQVGNTSVAIYKSNGSMRQMTDVLMDIVKATEDMTDAQKDQALASFAGERSIKVFNSAILHTRRAADQGKRSVKDLEEAIEDSEYVSKRAAGTQEGGLGGALRKLRSAAETAGISLGDKMAPTLITISDLASKAFNAFKNLPDPIQNLIGAILGITTLAAPALMGLGLAFKTIGFAITPLAKTIGFLGAGIGKFASLLFTQAIPAMWSFITSALTAQASIFGLTVPIWAVIGVLALLGVGLWQLYQNADKVFGWLPGLASQAGQGIIYGFNTTIDFFKNLPSNAFSWGKNMIWGFLDGVKSMFGVAGQVASNLISHIGGWLKFWSPAKKGEGRYIRHWGRNMVKGFIEGVENAKPLLSQTMNGIFQTPKFDMDRVVNTITSVSSSPELYGHKISSSPSYSPYDLTSSFPNTTKEVHIHKTEVVLNINGKELYRLTGDDLIDFLDKQRKREGRGG